MHWSGKLWLGLVIVLAPLDAYFALVLIAHRDKWNDQYATAANKYESQHADLLRTRREVLDRQYKLDRLENEWGTAWDGVGGGVLNAGDARLRIEVGFAGGLPTQSQDGTNPLVYIFQDKGEDGSVFLGEFELVTVEADQSGARLTRTPFGNEVMDWPADNSGAQFRVRHRIPSSGRSLLDSLYVQYTEEERSLDLQQRQLQRMDEQLAKSQSILDQRIAELSGDPAPPVDAADVDAVLQKVADQGTNSLTITERHILDLHGGLVETIRREEVDRNADLELLYNRRREYLRKTNELTGLIAGNKERVSELPGAEAAARPATPSAIPATVSTTTEN